MADIETVQCDVGALKEEIFDLSRHTMASSLPRQSILIIHGRLRR